MISIVILECYMIRICLPEVIEKSVECTHSLAVFFIHITGSQHLHHHCEILLIFRSLILQVEDKSKEKHLSSGIPERI